MVTGRRAAGSEETAGPFGPVADRGDLILRVDGSRPLSTETVAELGAACGRAEDGDTSGVVLICVSGVPGPQWPSGLSVALVSKWERELRRLERLPAVTIAVADDDCGGPALDALLATDYRIMPAWAKLVVPVVAGVSWPGMALYRLARQAAGAAHARRAALFGMPIGAATAQAMGVIDEVTDNATISLERAMEVAAAAEGTELAIRRQLVLEAPTTTFEDALGIHLAACDRALRRAATGPA
jgi:isomerase DpgB